MCRYVCISFSLDSLLFSFPFSVHLFSSKGLPMFICSHPRVYFDPREIAALLHIFVMNAELGISYACRSLAVSVAWWCQRIIRWGPTAFQMVKSAFQWEVDWLSMRCLCSNCEVRGWAIFLFLWFFFFGVVLLIGWYYSLGESPTSFFWREEIVRCSCVVRGWRQEKWDTYNKMARDLEWMKEWCCCLSHLIAHQIATQASDERTIIISMYVCMYYHHYYYY